MRTRRLLGLWRLWGTRLVSRLTCMWWATCLVLTFLLLEALRGGVIVHRDVVGLERLVFAVGMCNDFMISRRKLGYTETLVGRVLGHAP